MCLSSELLHLKYSPKHKDYVGIGYKQYCDNGSNEISTYCGAIEIGKWYDAVSLQNKDYGNRKSVLLLNEDYYTGFHILLIPEDAEQYSREKADKSVFKVEYKTIVGFGYQKLFRNNTLAVCVISKYMRIVERVII